MSEILTRSDLLEFLGLTPEEAESDFKVIEQIARLAVDAESERMVFHWLDMFAEMSPEDRLKMFSIIGNNTEDVVRDITDFINNKRDVPCPPTGIQSIRNNLN